MLFLVRSNMRSRKIGQFSEVAFIFILLEIVQIPCVHSIAQGCRVDGGFHLGRGTAPDMSHFQPIRGQ